jgi:hypothetical protein
MTGEGYNYSKYSRNNQRRAIFPAVPTENSVRCLNEHPRDTLIADLVDATGYCVDNRTRREGL